MRNKKKYFLGVVTLVTAIAIILLVTLSLNSTGEASQATTNHNTKSLTSISFEKKVIEIEELVATETDEVKDSEAEKTADEEASATTVLSDPATKYVTISSLNVRSGAGTNHSAIDTVTEGEEVTVYETNGSWSKVEFDSQSGWVSSNYLSDTKLAVKETTTVAAKATTEKESTSTPSTTKKEESKPKETSNVADGLRTVDSNNQLILVTTDGTNTSNATIQTFEKDGNGNWQSVLNISGYVGKNGLASNKVEGDKKAPIGKFTIGTAFGTKGNPGTKLPFRNITDDDVWVDDSNSALYNSWQSKSETQGQWSSAENMKIGAYANGFVINYNTQRTPGKGSAIFFHIGSSYTLGCTATSEANVVKIMKWLDPGKSPVIIQTPTENISNY